MTLLPNADGASTAHWQDVGESTHWECLVDNDGFDSYVKSSTGLSYFVIEFANPTVAEADIAQINTGRF